MNPNEHHWVKNVCTKCGCYRMKAKNIGVKALGSHVYFDSIYESLINFKKLKPKCK